jgi:hypothetical protein
MRLKLIHILCFLFLVFDSCIEPFAVTLPDNRGYVVIDGLITDQPGPYTVRLFRPNSLNDQLTTVNRIKGASLIIHDDLNNSVTLTEQASGSYETDSNFRGVPGRTYTLQVSISTEERYESLPQKLLPVGEIEHVYHEFVQVEDSTTANVAKEPKNGFTIFLDGNLAPEQNKFARWRTTGTYQILAFPSDRYVPDPESPSIPPPLIWEPPPCSGIAPKPFVHLLGPCTCCDCWISVYDTKPILSDAKFLNDDHVTGLELAFVPARKDYFTYKYHFTVEQMSITPEAYQFWLNIKKQEGTGNDLFQTPAGRALSNVRTVGDTQTPIIGLFGVSSVRSYSFYIDRSEVPYRLWDPDRFEDSCLKAANPSLVTNKKPDFWN